MEFSFRIFRWGRYVARTKADQRKADLKADLKVRLYDRPWCGERPLDLSDIREDNGGFPPTPKRPTPGINDPRFG